MRQSSGAFSATPKAAEDCRTPRRWRAQSAATKTIGSGPSQTDADAANESKIQNLKSKIDFDFRWSLAREDGQPLPPILLGDHIGAAFAFALGKLAGIEPFEYLQFRGCSVFGAIDASGKLKQTSFPSALFQGVLETAARAREIAILLSAPETPWPGHWAGPTGSPIQIERCQNLRELANALLPASLVIEAECKAAAEIEFLTLKVPIEPHYEDLPLLREVPRAEVRENQIVPSSQAVQAGPEADPETRESARRTVSVLTANEILAHKSGGTFDEKLVDWRDLFRDFAGQCPHARSKEPHFVVIGAPGTGKSTFAQFVAWLGATGQEPLLATTSGWFCA